MPTAGTSARLVKSSGGKPIARDRAVRCRCTSIAIVDGSVAIDDRVGSTAYRLPERIDELDVKAGFEYAPVHFAIELEHLSFTATRPDSRSAACSGDIAVRDDNLYLEHMAIETGETSLDIDGVIEQYLRTPVIKLVTTGDASLPEIGRVLPAVAGYDLHPDAGREGRTARSIGWRWISTWSRKPAWCAAR